MSDYEYRVVSTRSALLDYPPDKRIDQLRVECTNPRKKLVAIYIKSKNILKLEAQ